MRKAAILLGLALLAGGVQSAEAQHHRGLRRVEKHDGFWLSFGAGGGWEDTDFTLGHVGRGGAGYVRMGGSPSNQALFGVEALAWFNQDRFGGDIARVNVMAITQLYPTRNGALFVKGGFGFSSYESAGWEVNGLGTTIGMGVDIRLGRNFFLTPNVDYMVQYFERETVGNLLFTVGVTWH